MHANARLTERCRQELWQAVSTGMTPIEAASRFGVSRTTVYRWVSRARAGEQDWWRDRSSRPHSSPLRISAALEHRILKQRRRYGMSPVKIAPAVGVAASTVWRALVRAGLNRTPPTPRQLQARYERPCCGDLVHIDTKRAGKIPPGGGRRVRGIAGYRTKTRKRLHTGHVYFHAAVDDHSRLAYVEVRNGRTGTDTAAFLTRAVQWFRSHGIEVRQVMTDNAYEYVHSKAFQTALGDIDHIRTRPYRPQTNGKVERYFRTLKDEWLYATAYHSEPQRQEALTRYLHYYNHHRPHTAITNQPPITRVTNLPKQHR